MAGNGNANGISIKNGTLFIELPLDKKGVPSASGKTLLLATTHGAVKVDGADGVFVNCTVYKKPK